MIAFRAGQSVAHMHTHFIRSGLGVLTSLGTDGRGSHFSHNTNLPLFLQIMGPKRPISLASPANSGEKKGTLVLLVKEHKGLVGFVVTYTLETFFVTNGSSLTIVAVHPLC